MSTESYLTIASIVVTGIVGIVLRQQIHSQKQLIEQYKTYIETLDISKFKEYICFVEETGEKKIAALKEELSSSKEKDINKLREIFVANNKELMRYIAWDMKNTTLPDEKKIEFIDKAFPRMGDILKLMLGFNKK